MSFSKKLIGFHKLIQSVICFSMIPTIICILCPILVSVEEEADEETEAEAPKDEAEIEVV